MQKTQASFPVGSTVISDKGLTGNVVGHFNGGLYICYDDTKYTFWLTFLDFEDYEVVKQ